MNFPHTLSVQPMQFANGVTYTFDRWSDGVTDAVRSYPAPSSNSTITAIFTASGVPTGTTLCPDGRYLCTRRN